MVKQQLSGLQHGLELESQVFMQTMSGQLLDCTQQLQFLVANILEDTHAGAMTFCTAFRCCPSCFVLPGQGTDTQAGIGPGEPGHTAPDIIAGVVHRQTELQSAVWCTVDCSIAQSYGSSRQQQQLAAVATNPQTAEASSGQTVPCAAHWQRLQSEWSALLHPTHLLAPALFLTTHLLH